MKRSKAFFTILALSLVMTGCSGMHSLISANNVPENGKTLTADGYSQFEDAGKLNFSHQWFSAQQLAKLNAYRGLADQLYYEPLGDHKTVGSQVISHEVYRIYLDTYLREARASDYRTLKDNLKTTLELKLTPRFYRCMGGDVAEADRCIREDGKMPYTRLGYKTAASTSINLACSMPDCSDQFHVKGFSKSRHFVDDALLDAGFYDTEWTVNTGARMLFNHLLLHGIINAL